MELKCHICGKKAVGRLSPDLDIKGIGFCKKHKEQIQLAYMALLQGDEKLFEQLLKSKT